MRTDSLYITGTQIRASQALSLFLLMFGLFYIAFAHLKNFEKKPFPAKLYVEVAKDGEEEKSKGVRKSEIESEDEAEDESEADEKAEDKSEEAASEDKESEEKESEEDENEDEETEEDSKDPKAKD